MTTEVVSQFNPGGAHCCRFVVSFCEDTCLRFLSTASGVLWSHTSPCPEGGRMRQLNQRLYRPQQWLTTSEPPRPSHPRTPAHAPSTPWLCTPLKTRSPQASKISARKYYRGGSVHWHNLREEWDESRLARHDAAPPVNINGDRRGCSYICNMPEDGPKVGLYSPLLGVGGQPSCSVPDRLAQDGGATRKPAAALSIRDFSGCLVYPHLTWWTGLL